MKIESNNLASEFGACAMFSIDPWDYFQRPRDYRKAVTGYFIGRNALDAMRQHDTRPKPKKGKGGKS